MKVTSIRIQNIVAIEEREILPGREATIIEGPNGTGKSTILNAIRAALGSGHDATLIRKGHKKGQIVLLLEDGTEITKTITETRSDTRVKLPEAGTISAPKRFLDGLLDSFSLNPVDFLTSPPKYRAQLLLEAMPLTVTAKELNACLPKIFEVQTADFANRHPLEVIADVTKQVYSERTAVNRIAKSATAAVEEAKKALPPSAAAQGLDWDDLLKEENDRLDIVRKETEETVTSLLARREKNSDAVRGLLASTEQDEQKQATKDLGEIDDGIEKLRLQMTELQNDARVRVTQRDTKIHALRRAAQDQIAGIKQATQNEIDSAREALDPQREEIVIKIADLNARRTADKQADSIRGLISQRQLEADENETQSKIYTESLAKIEKLRQGLVSNLPIQGVEVREGEVFVHDATVNEFVPFDRANDARRVRIAIEIAKVRARQSKVPLIIVDRMQELDPNQFALFEKEIETAKSEGFQFVLARATGDAELKIRTS